jgi:hypothetical protein
VVALTEWWLRPPDATALAAAMRRESAQQVAALSREIDAARAELARKASGLSLQTVVGSTLVAAGRRGEIVLTCPPGTQPLSGGLKDQDDAAPLREVESFPDGARWILRVANGAPQGEHVLIAFVLCGALQ